MSYILVHFVRKFMVMSQQPALLSMMSLRYSFQNRAGVAGFTGLFRTSNNKRSQRRKYSVFLSTTTILLESILLTSNKHSPNGQKRNSIVACNLAKFDYAISHPTSFIYMKELIQNITLLTKWKGDALPQPLIEAHLNLTCWSSVWLLLFLLTM